MSVVISLLRAIDRADGEALVMHIGEKPYVVTATGHAELASRELTFPAMTALMEQLLTAEAREQLEQVGVVEHLLPNEAAQPDIRYSVVAARGGDDIWIEIRRRKELPPEAPPSPAVSAEAAVTGSAAAPPPAPPAPEPVVHVPPAAAAAEHAQPAPAAYVEPQRLAEPQPVPEARSETVLHAPAREPGPQRVPRPTEPPRQVYAERYDPEPQPEPIFIPMPAGAANFTDDEDTAPPPPAPAPFEAANERDTSVPPGVVVPIARGPVRLDNPPRPQSRVNAIHHLLRVAAARGASSLYLVSNSRPSIRVDGEVRVLEPEAMLTSAEVESSLLDFMPERGGETPHGIQTEWISDVPEVGRVRCVSYRDHRGPGAVFHMLPARAISGEQLGLSPEIQALCSETEGLVLVTGRRAAGKSTLIAAFVDQINRTRRDHLITIESQIQFVHESRNSLVSQREVRGEHDEMASTLHSAMRENPDVIVVEELRSADVASLAIDAAASGYLVIGALTAPSATAAVEKLIDMFPAERRAQVRTSLAENLRGIVAQVLLRKSAGGRVAAREVLLNNSAVASLIAEGRPQHLASALDSGRRIGMVPLNDALLGFVQSGAVESREAYRKSQDAKGLIALLKRAGIDTSFAERLA